MHESDLAMRLGVPRVIALDTTTSTMDAAREGWERHRVLGLVVVADRQQAGRGRGGNAWSSPAGGVWCTMIEKPADRAALDVLSIRVGLFLATALSDRARATIQLKWPNDLFRDGRKLGGILTEASWNGDALVYVAVGVGINVQPPADMPHAIGLPGIDRVSILECVTRAVRSAASNSGHLSDAELAQYQERDMLLGRRIRSPAAGVVRGIARDGSLVVESAGSFSRHRSGRIVLEEET